MSLAGSILGRRGERRAEKFLRRKGYGIISLNFRTRHGEIDLVCRDGDCLVFVEVKTRTAGVLGHPEDAVGAAKQEHLQYAAAQYVSQLRQPPVQYRLDVISIEKLPDGKEDIVHYENVTA